MNTPEHQDDTDDQPSVRVGKFQRSQLNPILKVESLAEQLYLERNLTTEEFNDKLLIQGYRAIMHTLVSAACSGDTKAMDLALKRCDLHFNSKRISQHQNDDASASPYSRPDRKATPDVDENPAR